VVQIATPVTTIFNNWALVGGATAHAVLSDGADGTYIGTATASALSVGTSTSLLTPAPGGPINFKARFKVRTPGAVGASFRVQMGSVTDGIVASRVVTASSQTNWGDITFGLSGAEITALTSFTDLAWRFVYIGGTALQLRIAQHEIELPDPATGGSNRWWSGWRHG